MKGDIINIRPVYYRCASALYNLLESKINRHNKYSIAIGGESGSGKSVTAICLKNVLEENNIRTAVMHLDDYFMLAPHTNHQRRKSDSTWFGMKEVRLDLLQDHVNQFHNNDTEITKPLSNYNADQIEEELLNIEQIQVLIIEGTYTMTLENINSKIFIDRNYIQTLESRNRRARDIEDQEFVETILALEHQIIAPQINHADIIIDEEFQIKKIK